MTKRILTLLLALLLVLSLGACKNPNQDDPPNGDDPAVGDGTSYSDFMEVMGDTLASFTADSRYTGWDTIAEINYSSPYATYFEGMLLDFQGKHDEAVTPVALASIMPMFPEEGLDFSYLRTMEADADGYNFPWYVESYYYDSSKRWMIYTSHDFTITFAGEKLVRTAKEIIDHKYLIK